MSNRTIALIGYMATGKSTIGKKLAKALDLEFIDTDAVIVKQQKRSIADIFEESGEATFRGLEHNVLKTLIDAQNVLISTGGGIILNAQNRELLKQKTFIVTLTARPESVYARIKGNKNRPLLNEEKPFDIIVKMMEERKPFYAIGDIIIATDELEERACVDRIISAYKKSEK